MEPCRHCKQLEPVEDLFDYDDGYGSDWMHKQCHKKAGEEFRAFLKKFRLNEMRKEQRRANRPTSTLP